jgi:hypothetical protein
MNSGPGSVHPGTSTLVSISKSAKFFTNADGFNKRVSRNFEESRFMIFLRKAITAGLLLTIAMGFTGCSAIRSVTSDAYALGLATGQEYAGLKETADNLQSWIPEEEGLEFEPFIKGDEASVREYCTGIWMLAGITSGLENSDSNESDFVSGCLDGAGF